MKNKQTAIKTIQQQPYFETPYQKQLRVWSTVADFIEARGHKSYMRAFIHGI